MPPFSLPNSRYTSCEGFLLRLRRRSMVGGGGDMPRSELGCELYTETILTPLTAKTGEEFCIFVFGRMRPDREISSPRPRLFRNPQCFHWFFKVLILMDL